MATPAIEVRGIRELGSALRQIDKELPKGIRTEFLPMAKMVVAAVKRKATAEFKHPTGQAISSIRPRASQSGAGIAFGGKAAPYYPWLDFGGSVGPKDATGHGTIHRWWIKGGRYVYPTIEEKRPEIMDAVDKAIVAVTRRAHLEVR